jgi:hypothetical protein
MDLGMFQRTVEIENGRDGSKRASILGVKEEEEGYRVATIFGIGADENEAKTNLAIAIVERAKAGGAYFMQHMGVKKPLVVRGNDVTF